MDGIMAARDARGMDAPSVPSAQSPGRALIEGYKYESLEKKHNLQAIDTDRSRPSELFDFDDTIQVHLLTEMALSDSEEFEVLSPEKVDDLKKQMQLIGGRIEQTSSTLAIQTKYLDAAKLMARFYSTTGMNEGEDELESEVERQEIERKCRELARELSALEKRMMDAQKRLLQHTAGILKLTHGARSRRDGQASRGPPLLNGIPGSPESLYAFAVRPSSPDPINLLDSDVHEANPSSTLDLVEVPPGQGRNNAIEIPPKSPVREFSQLREEVDRVKLEKARLEEEKSHLENELSLLRTKAREHQEMTGATETKLTALNIQVHKLISNSKPTDEFDPTKDGDKLAGLLKKLETGLVTLAKDQELKESSHLKEITRTRAEMGELKMGSAAASETAIKLRDYEERVKSLSRVTWASLQFVRPNDLSAPDESTPGLDAQLANLERLLDSINAELKQAADLRSSMSAKKQSNEQVETVLMGLWEIIQSGYADIQKQKDDRRRTRIEMGLGGVENDDEMSGDELMSTNQAYSLSAFSTQVQWLYAQATKLQEQKSVLKRQIKQQRDLNSKSDAEKDSELKRRTDELADADAAIASHQQQNRELQEQLVEATADAKALRASIAENEATARRAAEVQALETQARLVALEQAAAQTRAKLAEADTEIANLHKQLDEAAQAQETAEQQAEQLTKNLEGKEAELERLNAMVIELKTEATIAKAELEGAYGSRAERAAQVAALNKNSGAAGHTAQLEQLRVELDATLKELEGLTRETISAEKEKLELENRLDDAIAQRLSLEAEFQTVRDELQSEVARLREELDAEKLRAPPSPTGQGGQRAGAALLSERFRATMKEERKKFQDELKEEQARRRKLEDELRTAKRAQGGVPNPR